MLGKDLAEFMFLEPRTFALRLAAILKEEIIKFLKYKTPIENQALIEPKCVWCLWLAAGCRDWQIIITTIRLYACKSVRS